MKGREMELKELRQEINAIDEKMAELFIERMKVAEQIADYKMERGLAVEDKDREQRLIDMMGDKIEDQAMRPFYIQFLQNTMDVSKKWQHRLMIGQRAAYCVSAPGDMEAVSYMFPDAEPVPFETYEEAYDAAEEGTCDIAVLPFERSYEGEVGPVLDKMFEGSLHVNDVYDYPEETGVTRYAVLSKAVNKPESGRNTGWFMIMFTVKDEVGGLAKAINTISAYNFNMRIMRSRPMQGLPWNYYFYAEAEGDDSSENGRRMITALSAVCPLVKVIGRY